MSFEAAKFGDDGLFVQIGPIAVNCRSSRLGSRVGFGTLV